MELGDMILVASTLTATVGLGLFAWVAVGVGVRDRQMAAQIETTNMERAMRSMKEADDGRS